MRIRFHGRLANSLLVTVPLLLAPAVPLFAAPLSKSVLVPKTATGAKRATGAAVAPMLPLSALDAAVSAARQRNSRSVLAQDEALFKDAEPLTPNTPAPNYLRALAIKPAIVKPFAHLVKTAIYDGNVLPDIKMAMGLHIAQMHHSPYVMVHLRRLMQGRAQGKRLLAGLQNGISPTLAPQERLALRYAAQLTQSIHGVSDADFQEVRRYYNDSQIVELTTTVCFFNYFTRLCESLNLPIEEWALHPVPETKQHKANYHPVLARVGLISDDENTAFNNVAKSSLPHSPVATGGSATASTTPVSGPVATSASNATSPGQCVDQSG
jgi:alkylhydroperoxidase family enzyme